MLCAQCGELDAHEWWCDSLKLQSPESWMNIQMDEEIVLPIAASPIDWLLGGDGGLGAELPMVVPELDLSNVEGDCFDDKFMALLNDLHASPPLGGVQTVPMPLEASAQNETSDPRLRTKKAVVTAANGDQWEVDLYASDSSLEDGAAMPNILPVAIPGWNVSVDEDIVDNPTPGLWPNALELANELIHEGSAQSAGGAAETTVVGDGMTGSHVPAYERVWESPASPDEDPDMDVWSEVSSPGTYEVVYRPVTSPITDVPSPHTPPCVDRELGPSQAQKYWSKLQRGQDGREPGCEARPKKIAVVRPQRRRGRYALERQRRRYPRVFRIITQAPVIRSQSIISRVITPDGHVAIESMEERFDMARTTSTQTVFPRFETWTRTTATQTYTPLYADVQTGMTETDRPINVVILRLGALIEESGSVVVATASASETEAEEEAGPSGDSEGTPLLDE